MSDTPSHALQIGTFNTHLDSFIFEFHRDVVKAIKDFATGAGLSDFNSLRKAQAHAIADRILVGDFVYDVIALNEVFHEDARKVLVDRLSGSFPWVLRKLPDGPLPPVPGPLLDALPTEVRSILEGLTPGTNIEFEDSGLMLFSRFPIEKWVFSEFVLPSYDPVAQFNADAWAAKGALCARIVDPRSGRRIHVIAAHLQEEGAALRKIELAQIHDLLVDEVPHPELEDVIVLGDFNLDATLVPGIGDGLPPGTSSAEYDQAFVSPRDDTLGLVVRDAWRDHTSVRDLGWTSQGRRRIDLILSTAKASESDPVGMTFQRVLLPHHLTLAFNLLSAGGDPISDHMGVNAEYNRDAARCTPRRAAPVDLDTPMPGHIEYPAAVQWYRVDEKGTYAFAAVTVAPDGDAMDVKVYAANDLSRPVSEYKRDVSIIEVSQTRPVTARQFVLTDPPYYIRVRHEDKGWIGSYQFLSHRLTGQSKAEAIALVPFVPSNAIFPPGTPLNADDVAWFKVDLEAPDSGQPQHIELAVAAGKVPWTAVLLADDGATVLGVGPSTMDGIQLQLDDVSGRRYLKVQRNDVALSPANCEALFQSNLTIFHGGSRDLGVGWSPQLLRLVCENETDPQWGGSDSINISIWVDGALRVGDAPVGEFEEGDSQGIESIIPWPGFRYLDKVEVQLYEQDQGPDDPSNIVAIGGLGSKRFGSDDATFDFEGGIYTLQYNRSRWLPAT